MIQKIGTFYRQLLFQSYVIKKRCVTENYDIYKNIIMLRLTLFMDMSQEKDMTQHRVSCLKYLLSNQIIQKMYILYRVVQKKVYDVI